MILGYTCISDDEQDLDAQTAVLKAAGSVRIFSDRVTGPVRKRPQLEKLLVQLHPRDVMVVAKYDHLALSLKDLLDIVYQVKNRGAEFRSLAENIDTTSPAGPLIFHVFSSIAHFERECVSKRTRVGLQAARACGRVGGRPHALTAAERIEVRRMRDEDGIAVSEVASLFRVSQQTVRRA